DDRPAGPVDGGNADAEAGVADRVRRHHYVAQERPPAGIDAVKRRAFDKIAGDDRIGFNADTGPEARKLRLVGAARVQVSHDVAADRRAVAAMIEIGRGDAVRGAID